MSHHVTSLTKNTVPSGEAANSAKGKDSWYFAHVDAIKKKGGAISWSYIFGAGAAPFVSVRSRTKHLSAALSTPARPLHNTIFHTAGREIIFWSYPYRPMHKSINS